MEQLDTNKQLQELKKGQDLIVRRLGEMNGTLRDVVVEIGGAPTQLGRDRRRLSIRSRLHELENGKRTAVIAGAALEAAKQLRDDAAKERFTRREKIAGIAIATILAAGPYLEPLLARHHL